MGDFKENYHEEDSLNDDDLHNQENEQNKKPPKKKYMLRKKIEEDIKNSKTYISANGKLMQPQPQNVKRSFLAGTRRTSSLQKKMNGNQGANSSNHIGTSNVETKLRGDTVFSSKSAETEQFVSKQDDKKQGGIIEDDYTPEINGPQVELSKKDMSFIINTGLVSFGSLTVRNNGSASIYYEWRRVEYTRSYTPTILDPEQKFFCHHEQNVIKPGQQKNFVFAFMSKLTGIFSEEWELQCEPPPTHPIPRLKLTGNSIDVDELKEWRSEFDKDSLNNFITKNMNEIVNDIVDTVRTPTPPLPDLENEDVCRREFEEKNENLHLWYNPLVMKWWRILENDLYNYLGKDPEQQYWDLNLEYIKELIEVVDEEDDKFYFESRFNNYVELNKKPPVERSQIYDQVKDFIWKLAVNIPVYSDKAKEEVGMWEYIFRPPSDERDFTEAELKQFEEEKTKIKAEWMKKTKKKKWTDEEEKKMIEDYKVSLSTKVSQEVQSFFEGFEEKDEYNRALYTISNRKKEPEVEYFEQLLRKKPLKDIDIDGKRLVLRVHLKISKEPGSLEKKIQNEQRLIEERDENLRKIEEEKALAEKMAKEKKKTAKRPPPPPKKGGKGQVEEEKPKEKIIDVSFLDEDCLTEIVDGIKYLFERQAKLVILMVSYDNPIGEFKFTSSVKFFVEYLKKQIENQVQFNETIYIDNFEEKIETESYPDNSVLVLENAYFVPEEIGFKQEIVTDESGNSDTTLIKSTLEDKQTFINTLSNYAPSLIVEDKENFFLRMTSLVGMKFENQVLGYKMSEEIEQISHLITFDKPNFHIFLGGDLTPSKLIAIDSLSFFAQIIHLYGVIGIKFLIVQQEMIQEEKNQAPTSPSNSQLNSIKPSPALNLATSNVLVQPQSAQGIVNANFSQFIIQPIEKLAIKGVLTALKLRNKTKLILPQDFVIVPDAEIESIEKFSPQWFELQLTQAQNYPPKVISANNPDAIPRSQIQSPKSQSAATPQNQTAQRISFQATQQQQQSPTQRASFQGNLQSRPSQQLQQGQIVQSQRGSFAIQQQQRPSQIMSGGYEIGENQEEDEDVEYDEYGQVIHNSKQQNKNYNQVIEDVEEDNNGYIYDNNAQFPDNYVIVDYGEQTLQTIKAGIRKARKLGWIEELSIFSSISTNEANKIAARKLHKITEEKRTRLEQRKGINDYNYVNDMMVFLFGKNLEKQLNSFDLVEAPPQAVEEIAQIDEEASQASQDKKEQENPEGEKQQQEEDENKSQHSANTAVTKPNNVRVISDFFSRDSEFILKIIHATHIEALSRVDNYSIKTTSNLSDDFSFLDRL